MAKAIADSEAAIAKINTAKISPIKSFEKTDYDTKFKLTDNGVIAIDMSVTVSFFLFLKI
jgi:hypothetical protein